MGYLICILIGGLCGAILTNLLLRSRCTGTLIVNREDPEKPEVYAEFTNLEKLERKGVYVTFRVKELRTQKKQ